MKNYFKYLFVLALIAAVISLFSYLTKYGGLGSPNVTDSPIIYQQCDAFKKCPEGTECYKFNDENTPICWEGDPCRKCPSGKCIIAESYPMQVFCR